MKTHPVKIPTGQATVIDTRHDSDQAAYDAGLQAGREAGYQQGFQDGFLASLKNEKGAAVPNDFDHKAQDFELAPNGRPLVGPPCVSCGHCYPGALTECPRCKTPAPQLAPAQNLSDGQPLSV